MIQIQRGRKLPHYGRRRTAGKRGHQLGDRDRARAGRGGGFPPARSPLVGEGAGRRPCSATTGTAAVFASASNPDIFFPTHGDPGTKAREIRAACAVRGQCLDHVVTADEFGTWGGMDQEQRRRPRRRAGGQEERRRGGEEERRRGRKAAPIGRTVSRSPDESCRSPA
jgi:Transcription factor WhiB